jgi:hypothetical protein
MMEGRKETSPRNPPQILRSRCSLPSSLDSIPLWESQQSWASPCLCARPCLCRGREEWRDFPWDLRGARPQRTRLKPDVLEKENKTGHWAYRGARMHMRQELGGKGERTVGTSQKE